MFRVQMLVFSLGPGGPPVLCFLQPRAALRVLEGTQGHTVQSLKDFSTLGFPNSTTKGEIGFGSLIYGAEVLKLMLMDLGWSNGRP